MRIIFVRFFENMIDIKKEGSSLLDRFIDFFTNKKLHISKRLGGGILILVILIGINDYFSFSFNYKINSKLNQIEKIENIKSNLSEDYTLNPELVAKLDLIEKEILEKEFILEFNTKTLTNREWKNTLLLLVYFLSIHWVWITFMIMSFHSFLYKKDERVTMFFVFLLMFFCAYIWHYIFIFIFNSLGLQTILHGISLNIFLFLLLIFTIISSTSKKK